MFSRLNQFRAGVSTRIFVTALALVLVCTCFPLIVFARDDLPKPHLQPGDGDGPAGVQEAVPIESRSDDMVPLWVVPAYRYAGVVVVNFVFWRVLVTLEITRQEP
jgi:hypothetical protein